MSTDQKISEFIEDSCLIRFGEEADADTNLFTTGIMDSMGFIELVQFLEADLNVKFADEELNSREFATLSGIQSIARRKQDDARP